MKKPGMITRLWVSLFLTAPLVIVFFLGWKVAGLSFVPFTLFDWISRILPGSIITFVIDSMVKTIRFFHFGSTAVAAKASEQAIAFIIFLIAGTLAGTLILSIFRRWKRSGFFAGVVAGISLTVILLLININLNRVTLVNEIWEFGVFIIWSSLLLLIYDKMLNTKDPENESVSVERIDRRRFLIRLGTASAAILVTGAAVNLLLRKKPRTLSETERWSATHDLPNINAEVKPAPGMRPEFTPLEKHYRIDINTSPPLINEENWSLKIKGLVEEPLELSLSDIRGYEPLDQFITLACISNPVGGDLISTTRWTGTSLVQILKRVKLKPEASHLLIRAADGFFETVSIDEILKDKRIMLTYAWDGVPLLPEHGFPLRIYIPGRYGMKQPKWIVSIEVMKEWEAGYWVVRGWDKEALMKATSVIDTVAVDKLITDPGGAKLVPVGGYAHAGDKGISKVEISIDNAGWQQAKLRTPLSDLTWVFWRFDMPLQQGEHTLTVRCFDGEGAPQIILTAPPHPSGATGLDTKKQKV